MKIEKGNLYYNMHKRAVFKSNNDWDLDDSFYSDKIAVLCYTGRDWEYVKSKGYELRRFIGTGIYSLIGVNYYDTVHYNITIDQFKEFYPDVVKTDEIVQNVVQKYQQRSNVGIEKYGTTLQESTDGIEVFLNHLQEELMDATLYIEKLKNKFAQLKKDL